MIRPLGKTMVIKRILPEKKSLILTTVRDDEPFKAVLVAKGKAVELEVEVGDTLLIAPFGGTAFDKNDEEHLLLIERDVLGVVI